MKLANITLIALCTSFTLGCTNTLSHGITDSGHVEMSNLVWPELSDAWDTDGKFPNLENLSKVRPDISKDDIYDLLGRPHFSESQSAREWDYIMKFYQENDTVKICQYKVIFDTEYKGQEFYWTPSDCPPMAPPKAAQIIREKITLDADALFKFNRADLNNILPSGRVKLDELADRLKAFELEGDVRIHLTGHTDYKGSHAYNQDLSSRRASTVLAYLSSKGISPATMSSSGAGEDYPVKQCSSNLPRQQEINCLQPNRRVEADVLIYKSRIAQAK